MDKRIKAYRRKDWSGCPECGSPTRHKKTCSRGQRIREDNEKRIRIADAEEMRRKRGEKDG